MKEETSLKNRTKKITTSSGFSILEVMVAVGILGVASYFVVSLLHTSLKGSIQTNVTVQAENIKRNLVNNFTNDPSWINTVKASPTLSACLAPLYSGGTASCPAGDYTNIVVKDGGGHLFYDSTATSNNGFDSNGAMCLGGFTSAGNDKCPFRVDIKVTLSCPSGDCSNPQVQIVGDMKFAPVNPAFKVSFNPAKYHFDFIRGQEASSLQATCDMLNGVYDSGPPPKCRVSIVPSGAIIAVNSTSCPPGYSVFTQAAGRLIVGVGGTSGYGMNDNGGSDTHTLSLAEMPIHYHDIGVIQSYVAIAFGITGRGGFAAGSFAETMGATGGLPDGASQPFGTPANGTAKPFDSRQAFYTLLYCQKN